MPIFDDTLAAQYIRAIENPDSIIHNFFQHSYFNNTF